jgi:hypothetical protein
MPPAAAELPECNVDKDPAQRLLDASNRLLRGAGAASATVARGRTASDDELIADAVIYHHRTGSSNPSEAREGKWVNSLFVIKKLWFLKKSNFHTDHWFDFFIDPSVRVREQYDFCPWQHLCVQPSY